MSESTETTGRETVRRACGVVAVALGTAIHALNATPLLALKVGGLLSLLASIGFLLPASRGAVLPFARASLWNDARRLAKADPAQTTAVTRRQALRKGAFSFALVSAMMLSLVLAGEAHLWLYPA